MRRVTTFGWLWLMLATIAGCTNWPPRGTGGMAERQPVPPSLANDPAYLAEERERLVCVTGRFETVAETAARRGVLQGQTGLARYLANRAKREYSAGLYGDTQQTLDRLEAETRHIRASMPENAIGPAPPPCRT